MHKIVFSLLIFLSIPTHAMLWLTPNLSFTYKRGNNNKAIFSNISSDSNNITFYDIPEEIICREIFPCNRAYQLITLIKKFDYPDDIKKTLAPIIQDALSLINLSQTNTHFHTIFKKEVQRRTELSHVSYNSIITYFKHFCTVCKHTICNFNCQFGMEIFYVRHNNPQGFAFLVYCTADSKLKIYDESDYINIHQLYTNIIKNVGDQKIRALCKKLQKECTITRTMRLQDFDLLKKLLIDNTQYEYVNKFNKYSSSATLAYATILHFTIYIHNKNKFNNVIDSCLDNENLVFTFSEYISALNKDVLATHWHSYYSFLQKLRLTTLNYFTFNTEYCLINFSTNCGFIDEPTIPVSIINCQRKCTFFDIPVL